jgi:glycosyltransferase involved in cell wall biosynthesis
VPGAGSVSGFGGSGPTTSVVVSVYNQLYELELVLAALAAQSDLAFDVILADDGSMPPARQLAERLAHSLPFAIRHVWQPDEGFCKARIQNVAALSTPAELLIFLDGDCLPFRDLVAVYRGSARPGEFMTGAVVDLDVATSRALTPASIRSGAHESAVRLGARCNLARKQFANWWYRNRRQRRPRIRGGNFAVAAGLFHAVNGFDESYCGYGKEDSDLRDRMRNAGARGHSLWTSARATHLSRKLSPSAARRSPEALYEQGRLLVRARIGLDGHQV